jgi:CheY-like chemotaxis protein/HPt (histidine-containing phosphotransfer) domain-containing protein
MIQADTRLAATRVILLQSLQEHRQTGFRVSGHVSALVKPILPNQLFDAISRVLTDPEAAPEPLRVAKRDATQSAPEPAAGASARILVVEDNPVNQQVACGWLRKLGYRADVAANGFEALEALERIPYAAVLMDCQMPEMDGFQATAELRRREGESTHTPVIAMTANVMQGDRERCLEAGMDDYVPKPVHLEDLDAALRRWLPSLAAEGPATAAEEPRVDASLRARLRQLDRSGREGELAMLVGMFVEDTASRLRLLQEAAARQDAGALRDVAHALRGAAGHFGLTEMVERCERIEALARAGTLGGAPQAVGDLETAFGRAREALESASPRPRAARAGLLTRL